MVAEQLVPQVMAEQIAAIVNQKLEPIVARIELAEQHVSKMAQGLETADVEYSRQQGELRGVVDAIKADLLKISDRQIGLQTGGWQRLLNQKRDPPRLTRQDMFRSWRKKTKNFLNAKQDGFRKALTDAEVSEEPIQKNCKFDWDRQGSPIRNSSISCWM